MGRIDWSKWIKTGAVVAVTALAVPELQQAIPAKAVPWVNAIIAAGALWHRYHPTEQAPQPQEPPKS